MFGEKVNGCTVQVFYNSNNVTVYDPHSRVIFRAGLDDKMGLMHAVHAAENWKPTSEVYTGELSQWPPGCYVDETHGHEVWVANESTAIIHLKEGFVHKRQWVYGDYTRKEGT